MLDFENTSSRGSVQCESFVEGFGQPAIGSEGLTTRNKLERHFEVRRAKIGPLRRNLLSFNVDEQYRHGAGMEYRLKLLMARVVKICKQSSRHLVDHLLLAAGSINRRGEGRAPLSAPFDQERFWAVNCLRPIYSGSCTPNRPTSGPDAVRKHPKLLKSSKARVQDSPPASLLKFGETAGSAGRSNAKQPKSTA